MFVLVCIKLRIYTLKFARKALIEMPALLEGADIVFNNDGKNALDLFASASYDDMWDDGDLVSVVKYLYGARGLVIPPEWKPLMPVEL